MLYILYSYKLIIHYSLPCIIPSPPQAVPLPGMVNKMNSIPTLSSTENCPILH